LDKAGFNDEGHFMISKHALALSLGPLLTLGAHAQDSGLSAGEIIGKADGQEYGMTDHPEMLVIEVIRFRVPIHAKDQSNPDTDIRRFPDNRACMTAATCPDRGQRLRF
jgi:hypothetical protein